MEQTRDVDGGREAHQLTGQQQQTGQQIEPSAPEAGVDDVLAQGQSPAPVARSDAAVTAAPQAPPLSTSAQRSGGQEQGGAGSNNASFEGTSFGGQGGSASEPSTPVAPSQDKLGENVAPPPLDGQ